MLRRLLIEASDIEDDMSMVHLRYTALSSNNNPFLIPHLTILVFLIVCISC